MYNYLKYLCFVLVVAFFTAACTPKTLVIKEVVTRTDISALCQQADNEIWDQGQVASRFLQRYFKPWEQEKLSYTKSEAMWGVSYKNRKIYLENYLPVTAKWFDNVIDNANFDAYNLETRKAITIKNTDVKILPTTSPFFYNPQKPGEGFPFDYNQNSRLKINTPLTVSHFSKDKAWLYVESFFVGGWVSIDSVAFVDEQFMDSFKTSDYFVSIKEKFSLYDPYFRDYIKIGTIFPKSVDGFLIAQRDDNFNAKVISVNIADENVTRFPMGDNAENRAKILIELLDEPYGWGGLLNNRDCSSFTQDYFMTFGRFIPRNSKAQASAGAYHDLSLLTLAEKKDYIKDNAIPFATLVYLKGHVMLYIGLQDSEPLVAHNLWSIRLKDKNNQEFRYIIGKAVVTTLEPGIELEGFDSDSNLLGKVAGITILH